MTKLIEFVLEGLKLLWPYLLAGAIGFSAAWWIQGVNVGRAENAKTAAESALKDYQTEQVRLAAEKVMADDKRREQTEKEYKDEKAKLQADLAAGNAFRRCIASGKCGGMRGVVSDPGGSAGLKLPPVSGANGASKGAVPATGGTAPQVISDCAADVLQLNKLQADIEKQGK